MADWKNEDDIKAELRVLTDELRHLREELRNMVTPPTKPHPSRAFLHRQSWPQSLPPRIASADANERAQRRPKPKKNR